MSMELSTFQAFPRGRQGLKSPLNVLVEVKLNPKIQCLSLALHHPKEI